METTSPDGTRNHSCIVWIGDDDPNAPQEP